MAVVAHLTRVHALCSDEELLVMLVLDGVSEGDLQQNASVRRKTCDSCCCVCYCCCCCRLEADGQALYLPAGRRCGSATTFCTYPGKRSSSAWVVHNLCDYAPDVSIPLSCVQHSVCCWALSVECVGPENTSTTLSLSSDYSPHLQGRAGERRLLGQRSRVRVRRSGRVPAFSLSSPWRL